MINYVLFVVLFSLFVSNMVSAQSTCSDATSGALHFELASMEQVWRGLVRSRLLEAMTEADITTDRLEAQLEVSGDYLRRIVRGNIPLRVRVAKLIAEKLEVDLERLLAVDQLNNLSSTQIQIIMDPFQSSDIHISNFRSVFKKFAQNSANALALRSQAIETLEEEWRTTTAGRLREALGKQLAETMDSSFSKQRFSRTIGVSPAQLSSALSGRKTLALGAARAAAQELGVDVKELLAIERLSELIDKFDRGHTHELSLDEFGKKNIRNVAEAYMFYVQPKR